MKNKDQQAQEYAADIEIPQSLPGVMAELITDLATSAWLDGYTAAEQSMWRSVEEELPKDDETVMTYSDYGPFLAYYSEQDKMWFVYGNYGDINPTHWMPIPSIPETNTEKK